QGILFHALFTPGSGIYVPQLCFTLIGFLDISTFRQVWQDVITRHQTFRASFHWEKRDRPFQVIYRQVELPWQEEDWQELSPDEQHKQLEIFLEEDRKRDFDLKNPPQMRLTLIRLTEDRYYLIWTQHHLILDGWSAGLVVQQVFKQYNDREHNLPLVSSRLYGDYIAWLQQQDETVAKTFWQKTLAGFTTPTRWGVERKELGIDNNFQQAEQQVSLSPKITTDLKTLAQQHQVTLNTIIRGAFALLLNYYSGEEDIVFGATCSGRSSTLKDIESMVGLFINTLPVRVHISPQQKLIPWLKQLQIQQAEASQYEYVSLFDIQQESDLPPGIPLFDSILVFENYPVDPSIAQATETLTIEAVSSVEWTSLPLTVLVGEEVELSIKIKYHCDRFSDIIINRLLQHFQTLLTEIAQKPQRQLWQFPILTPSEQEQLIIQGNEEQEAGFREQGVGSREQGEVFIHQLFETQVEKEPEAIALIFEDQQLTYQELNIKANQLAHYLQSLGVQPETLVGICLDRSLEMVIAILAILKAGGAYVPLDPSYPPERITFILKDAQINILLVTQDSSNFPVQTLIDLNKDCPQISQALHTNPTPQISLDNSIYALYTSGSTGKPKGVINTHRGVLNRLNWMQKAYGLTSGDRQGRSFADRVLQKTPYTFDVSVWEFLWTLLNGACLVIAKPGGHQDSGYLVDLIITQQITTIHFVPSMLQVFLEEANVSQCSSLKRVICSGEALSVDLKNRFFQKLNAQLHNLYGPTEAAIDVTAWSCQPDDLSVPIGQSIDNIQGYVLNKQQQLVPVGVAGELYLGGEGLARGYLNRADLTAQCFVPNPFDPPLPPLRKGGKQEATSSRLYKTGDRVRYREDGSLEYLGRLDNQVKIRGVRLELGEVEAILEKYPDVIACAVLAKEFEPGDHRLIAYIQTPQTEDISQELREFLADRLPSYGIPSAFIKLESFPLTANGKLDRKALLNLNPDSVREIIAPRNATEMKIATIWAEILKIETLSIDDNFFELGGNSLLATRINSRLRQAFNLDLPLRTLFEKPTVASLAERIHVIQMSVQQRSIDSNQQRKEIEL
ncbi:MAG: amino acid adenylation domain-containing protein, partial [Cyanobacteria bacterium P01_G01_bin.49]